MPRKAVMWNQVRSGRSETGVSQGLGLHCTCMFYFSQTSRQGRAFQREPSLAQNNKAEYPQSLMSMSVGVPVLPVQPGQTIRAAKPSCRRRSSCTKGEARAPFELRGALWWVGVQLEITSPSRCSRPRAYPGLGLQHRESGGLQEACLLCHADRKLAPGNGPMVTEGGRSVYRPQSAGSYSGLKRYSGRM